MLEDLGKLIQVIQNNYERICSMWDSTNQNAFSLKKELVCDTITNADILNRVFEYRSLINDQLAYIVFDLDKINYVNSSVTSRVKAQNSIEYKLNNYCTNHENGKIPIKKCLNDLLGVRIVINEEFSHQNVKNYMQQNFPSYKCIDSSKLSYVATHIYFESGNFHFPWELQVWTAKNEKGNKNSHRLYKQEYTEWESKIKGGDDDGQAFYNYE